jgi:hypothetical protein
MKFTKIGQRITLLALLTLCALPLQTVAVAEAATNNVYSPPAANSGVQVRPANPSLRGGPYTPPAANSGVRVRPANKSLEGTYSPAKPGSGVQVRPVNPSIREGNAPSVAPGTTARIAAQRGIKN